MNVKTAEILKKELQESWKEWAEIVARIRALKLELDEVSHIPFRDSTPQTIQDIWREEYNYPLFLVKSYEETRYHVDVLLTNAAGIEEALDLASTKLQEEVNLLGSVRHER